MPVAEVAMDGVVKARALGTVVAGMGGVDTRARIIGRDVRRYGLHS